MADLKLKRTRPEHRRFFTTLCCDDLLSDGTPVSIGAENDIKGGVVVTVGAHSFLLPYAALVKAADAEIERG